MTPRRTLTAKDKAKGIDLSSYFDQETALRQFAVDTLTKVIAEDGLPDEVRPVEIVQTVTRRMWQEAWPRADKRTLLPQLRTKVQLCITRRLRNLIDENFGDQNVPMFTAVPISGTAWRLKRTAELTYGDISRMVKYEGHKITTHRKNKDKAQMRLTALTNHLNNLGVKPESTTVLAEAGVPIDLIVQAANRKDATVTKLSDKRAA